MNEAAVSGLDEDQMGPDNPTSPAADTAPWSARTFGSTLNEVGWEELLAHYKEVGFLYPRKLQRLKPHLVSAAAAWERMTAAGDGLRRVYSWRSPDGQRWAHVDLWRSTETGWWVQHLVANGGAAGARAMLLASTARVIQDAWMTSCEAWFRPDNPFPNRVLGGSVPHLGADAGRNDQDYISLPLSASIGAHSPGMRVRETCRADADLLELASAARHPGFPAAVSLASDPCLAVIDRRYRLVGLRRYRRIWTVRDRRGRLLGAALAHRGPIGLNFSFLENRCDLLLASSPPDVAAEASAAVLGAAVDAYADFLPGFMPVLVAEHEHGAPQPLITLGGQFLNRYAQVVWLTSGLPQLYTYFDTALRRPGATEAAS